MLISSLKKIRPDLAYLRRPWTDDAYCFSTLELQPMLDEDQMSQSYTIRGLGVCLIAVVMKQHI